MHYNEGHNGLMFFKVNVYQAHVSQKAIVFAREFIHNRIW